MRSSFLLIVLALTPVALCYDPAPPPKRPPGPPRIDENFTNPIDKPIINSQRAVHVRKFAQIPKFKSPNFGTNRVTRLQGIVSRGGSVFVTTGTSGASIYQVFRTRRVFLWANVQEAVFRDTGRNINCESGQHGGLRGLAFPPDYGKTKLFYVSFLEDRPKDRTGLKYLSDPGKPFPDSVVVEFKYDEKRRRIVPGSYRSVIRIGMPSKDHPIKQIAFMGKNLLIGQGDGSRASSSFIPGGQANNGLGKIIRINPKRRGNRPYTIPPTNPFIGNGKYRNEIYAVGLRNPHNICYSKKSGIYVADIGRDNVEEINIIKAGANYGWPKREGTFVHLRSGGTLSGIAPLPKDDAKFGYVYPTVQLGHFQPYGGQIRWQIAIAGSCPIENGSNLDGLYFYGHFGERGELFFSFVKAMKKAQTKGAPGKLRQARVYQTTRILYDHDDDPKTPPKRVRSLVELVGADIGRTPTRSDVRFGRGPDGELLITSKVSGAIYQVTNSLPK